MAKANILTNAKIHKVDLVPAGAQQLSTISIMKGANNMELEFDKLTDEQLDEIQCLMNQLKEKLGITDKAEEKTETKTEEEKECETEPKVEEKTETETKTEVEEKACESASESTDELKKALKKSADLESENSKLKEQIQKMNDEAVTKSFIAKAAELKNIPGISEQELGQVLKSISATDLKMYETVYNVLKTANDVIGKGSMFNELGTSSTSSGEPSTADEAWHLLEKMAAERVTKGLSKSNNCMSEVLDTPEGIRLYNQYKALKGGN